MLITAVKAHLAKHGPSVARLSTNFRPVTDSPAAIVPALATAAGAASSSAPKSGRSPEGSQDDGSLPVGAESDDNGWVAPWKMSPEGVVAGDEATARARAVIRDVC